MASRKLEHLNETVRQKLGQLLIKEASDPRFHAVTITGVKLAKDLSTARVEFSSYDHAVAPDELAGLLNKAAGFFGRSLARTLTTRRTPRLHFFYDPGFDYAAEMDAVLHQIEPLPDPDGGAEAEPGAESPDRVADED